jgi:hypothetical protein
VGVREANPLGRWEQGARPFRTDGVPSGDSQLVGACFTGLRRCGTKIRRHTGALAVAAGDGYRRAKLAVKVGTLVLAVGVAIIGYCLLDLVVSGHNVPLIRTAASHDPHWWNQCGPWDT